jgi:hypothetical protein
MDFLGGAPYVKYPRWVRRAYILTFPFAAPARVLLLLLGILSFFAAVAVLMVPALLCEKFSDLWDDLRVQWNT